MEFDYNKLADMVIAKMREESQHKKSVREMTDAEFQFLKKNMGAREIPFKSTSEMGEAFDNLDNDSFIDMNSRLSDDEISACTVIDELKSLGIFPSEANITKQFKRLKVSLQGKGRQEKVSVVTGTKEKKAPGSFTDLFKRREKKDESTNTIPTGV